MYNAEFPAFVENGLVVILTSIDTEAGSNLLMIMDANYIFADEAIDVQAYIQAQIEDLKQVGVSEISTHSVTLDGIKGTQIRYTMEEAAFGRANILIDEDEIRMLCGQFALLVQGFYGSDAQLNVLEKAIESLRILPTAAGELESCD